MRFVDVDKLEAKIAYYLDRLRAEFPTRHLNYDGISHFFENIINHCHIVEVDDNIVTDDDIAAMLSQELEDQNIKHNWRFLDDARKNLPDF